MMTAIRHPAATRAVLLIIALLLPIAAAASTVGHLFEAAKPGLLELCSVAITALIGWAVARARARWGIEIAARHREALHSALLTAARLALANQLTGQAAVEMIVDYARQSVPDALASLNPTSGVLDDLARSKLAEAAPALDAPLVRQRH